MSRGCPITDRSINGRPVNSPGFWPYLLAELKGHSAKSHGFLTMSTGLQRLDLKCSLEVQAQGDPLHGDQPELLPDLAEGQVLG